MFIGLVKWQTDIDVVYINNNWWIKNMASTNTIELSVSWLQLFENFRLTEHRKCSNRMWRHKEMLNHASS